MSTRLYPLYQKGNPQLRIFLPNFFMKMVKPLKNSPPNCLKFIVSKEMSKYDVRNYLKSIYNVEVAHVQTHLAQGRFYKDGLGQVNKEDDFKIAYVFLPKDQTFEFPNLYPDKKKEEDESEMEKSKESLKAMYAVSAKKKITKPDAPSWFSF